MGEINDPYVDEEEGLRPALITADLNTYLNPRHVERVTMEQRLSSTPSPADPQPPHEFRVLAHTPESCYQLTSWTDLDTARSCLHSAGRMISLV